MGVLLKRLAARFLQAAGVLTLGAVALSSVQAQSQGGNTASRFDTTRFLQIDRLIADAVLARRLPGAVVVVGDARGIAYRKAFGDRALEPSPEPMTADTVFDVASLTKVIATTTSIMMLVETGRVRLADHVTQFIPEFGRDGKDTITLEQLLTHMSGLRADLDLTSEWHGEREAIRLACAEKPVAKPGERFIYSDINFFVLGEIVKRVTGERLDRFAQDHIFEPLRLNDTMFLPPAALRPRIAPTQRCSPYGWPCDVGDRSMLRGVVHDPTARRMEGVAGHAGLFTSADDLARFARLLLNRGSLDGTRLLSPLTVSRMTVRATPPNEPNVRGLGWDIDSMYSTNRGDLMTSGSFGHTGFTGTSLWIDPVADMFVVFMSSRLHPDGRGDVTALRGQVATAAAAALVDAPKTWTGRAGRAALERVPPRAAAGVLSGIDVLRTEDFARLRGRRLGLLTNHTGRAADGASTIDLLHESSTATLVALFSPEHGIRGELDASVSSSVDEKTGLVIHSLYGDTRRPTAEMLDGIDTMVVDIQDVGARFYTYASTMAYVMEEAARRGIEVVVLDRPNPIDGADIEGPLLDADARGFTGYFAMPVRHGLTMGELARLFNEENGIGARLTVVEARGWRRELWFDETGQRWVNPSPNIRNLIAAMLYPGIGAIEWANVSVGRGTDSPFEQIGAPWIDGLRLAAALNARQLPGVSFYPVTFIPSSSNYARERCEGVFIIVADRTVLRPVRVGLEIAAALRKLHPNHFEAGETARLLGSRTDLERLLAGEDPAAIAQSWETAEAGWRRKREKYLLYR